jgi:predicted ArsR family transcriptional regulator
MLHAAGRPLGVREIAQRAGLHPNTARFHLEALVEEGLATRAAQERDTPGRPRMGYRAAARSGARRQYRLLSVMLASLIAGTMPEPSAAAEEAGGEWGAYFAERPPPYQRPSLADAVTRLAGIMRETGFDPQVVPGPPGDARYRLELRQCPFLEVAREQQGVVCALHLGLMRGAFEAIRAPAAVDELDAFAEPGLCVALISAEEGDSDGH